MGSGDTGKYKALLADFLKPQIGQPGPVYSGNIAPGASPLQTTAFDAAGNFVGGPSERDPAVSRLLAGETGFVPDTGEGAAYYNANVVKPLQHDFTFGLNAVDQRLGNMGLANSGVRARALTEAQRQYLDQVERGRSEFAYKDRTAYLASRESALDRMGGAIAQSLGIDLAKIGTASDQGGIQRQITGQQNSDAYRRFLESQPIYNPALAIIGGPQGFKNQIAPASATASPWATTVAGLTGGLTGYFTQQQPGP